jgi:hypothetical protein
MQSIVVGLPVFLPLMQLLVLESLLSALFATCMSPASTSRLANGFM